MCLLRRTHTCPDHTLLLLHPTPAAIVATAGSALVNHPLSRPFSYSQPCVDLKQVQNFFRTERFEQKTIGSGSVSLGSYQQVILAAQQDHLRVFVVGVFLDQQTALPGIKRPCLAVYQY